MTENEPMIKGDWRKATNEQIVSNLVEKIEELLGGKAHYIECSDRTTYPVSYTHLRAHET